MRTRAKKKVCCCIGVIGNNVVEATPVLINENQPTIVLTSLNNG